METIADTNWLLSALVFAPLAGALVMVLIPQQDEQSHKRVALITSVATLGLAALLLVDFDYGRAGSLQYFVDAEWIEVIGAGYTIGVDGMSLPLVALTALVMPLVFVYSWNHIPNRATPRRS